MKYGKNELLRNQPITPVIPIHFIAQVALQIRSEIFKAQISDPTNQRFDRAISLSLMERMKSLSLRHLEAELSLLGINHRINERDFIVFPCPCCGRMTIDEEDAYDICRVCWWEDSGIDNINAHMCAPNSPPLLEARVNFIKYGICQPERDDLIKLKHPKNGMKKAGNLN